MVGIVEFFDFLIDGDFFFEVVMIVFYDFDFIMSEIFKFLLFIL